MVFSVSVQNFFCLYCTSEYVSYVVCVGVFNVGCTSAVRCCIFRYLFSVYLYTVFTSVVTFLYVDECFVVAPFPRYFVFRHFYDYFRIYHKCMVCYCYHFQLFSRVCCGYILFAFFVFIGYFVLFSFKVVYKDVFSCKQHNVFFFFISVYSVAYIVFCLCGCCVYSQVFYE